MGPRAAWGKEVHLTSWSCPLYPSDLGTEDLSEWSVSAYRDALKWGRRALQPDIAPQMWSALHHTAYGDVCWPAPVVAAQAAELQCGQLSADGRTLPTTLEHSWPTSAARMSAGLHSRILRLTQLPTARVSGASQSPAVSLCSARSSLNPQPTPAPSPPAAASSAPAGTKGARRNSGKVSFASSAVAEARRGVAQETEPRPFPLRVRIGIRVCLSARPFQFGVPIGSRVRPSSPVGG